MPSRPSTVDRLLDAAISRFDAGGPPAVTIGGVRLDAGVSVGAVYHHFANRQALMDAAWLRCLESHQRAMLGAITPRHGSREGIHAGVRAYIEWHVAHRPAARMLREPGPTPDRPDAWTQRKTLNRPFFAQLRTWWGQREQAGELRTLPPALIHALWFGPARDVCDLWLGDAEQHPPDGHIEALGAAAWRSVGFGPG